MKSDEGNGEPLERFFKRMVLRWDSGLMRIERMEKRIESLERKTDHIMKYLLRREIRDQERWKENQARWEENQVILREILARLPKSA